MSARDPLAAPGAPAHAGESPHQDRVTFRPKVLYHQVLVSPQIGGAAELAIAIHHYLSRRYPQASHLVIPKGGKAEQLAVSQGLPFAPYNLDRLQAVRRTPTLYENLRLALRIRPFRTGIIHIHSPFVYGALRPLLRSSRYKAVLHVHLDYAPEELEWPLRVAPDLIFVCAAYIKPTVERVLAARTHRTKVTVLQNAVNTDKFFPMDRAHAKRSRGIDPSRTVLLMTANLAPHKGQDTAIRALGLLATRGYRPLLWLLGQERDEQAGYSDYLKTLANDLGVSELVQFLGFRGDVPDLLRAADLLLLPSSREGLPLAVLEAQASKVPVLAAPTAGVPEVIESGKTGILIDPQNFAGYAEAIIGLIENPELARAMAEAALQQVKSTFTLDRYCERVAQQYDLILPGP